MFPRVSLTGNTVSSVSLLLSSPPIKDHIVPSCLESLIGKETERRESPPVGGQQKTIKKKIPNLETKRKETLIWNLLLYGLSCDRHKR